MNGFCTWEELTREEIVFYALIENDREFDKEVFKLGGDKIERFE